MSEEKPKGYSAGRLVFLGDETYIIYVYSPKGQAETDAGMEKVARAINTHDTLVEACEAALKALTDGDNQSTNLGALCGVASAQENITRALAAAKGEA